MTERNRSIRRPPALESNIKDSIRKRLLKMGCWLRKFSPSPWGYQAGTLDFVGIYRGHGFCLEVKRPGYRPSDVTLVQRKEIDTVRKAGGWAGIVTSADEAERFLIQSEQQQAQSLSRIPEPEA